MKRYLATLLLIFLCNTSFAQEADDVDHLALAQILIKDGHYKRAEMSLEKLQGDQIKDKALYSALKGMIVLQKGEYQGAIDLFLLSQKQGMKDREIYLYLAESALQLNQLAQAAAYIEQMDSKDKEKIPYFLVKAEIQWKSGKKQLAWQTLDQALAKNLSWNAINKKKFSYLMTEQLYQSAVDLAFTLMTDMNNFKDVLAMASQMRIQKQYDNSLKILQAMNLLRPQDEMVALEMAQNYLALENSYSAALILEESAKHNISLSFEASELLRQMGKNYRAEFVNMTTVDPSKRLKQKMSLYLDEEDFHSLKFLMPQLTQLKMMNDEEIRYAVAYSLFRTGDFKKSEGLLQSIEKEGLFEKSAELKKEISECQKAEWSCSETI